MLIELTNMISNLPTNIEFSYASLHNIERTDKHQNNLSVIKYLNQKA